MKILDCYLKNKFYWYEEYDIYNKKGIHNKYKITRKI